MEKMAHVCVKKLSEGATACLVPSVTHCILGRPEQIRVTCPSIPKSNISQSAHYTKNTQDLSMKRWHLTSVHPSNLGYFFLRQIFTVKIRSQLPFVFDQHRDLRVGAFDQYVYNAICYGWILGPRSRARN